MNTSPASRAAAVASFAARSADYAAARPRYPDRLFAWLADRSHAHHRAWDCATGSGQAVPSIAAHFAAVVATDLSPEQCRHAPRLPNVAYAVSRAEAPALADRCVDLITVAQALHWFDLDRFWPEVARVGRPGALFCAWGTSWPVVPPEWEATLVAPLRDLVLPFWAANNRLLWDGYDAATLRCPFQPIDCPSFAIELAWSLHDLIAYMSTWSATKLAAADPLAGPQLESLLGGMAFETDAAVRRPVRMPLSLLAGTLG